MRVETVVQNNLCISCGICAGICPTQAIESVYSDGMYLPKINHEQCTNCGLCYKLCPGKSCDYKELYAIAGQDNPKNIFTGNYEDVFVLQGKNKEWLKNSGSGGVVSELVHELLKDKQYDAAFLVDTYSYGTEVFTHCYESLDDNGQTAKSRYVTVNQREAIRYIRENRKKKVILVGTSCFIQGFWRVMKQLHLQKDNYFLIGLFCEQTMNYRVWEYFQYLAGNKKMTGLHFKNKETGGWPGNMMLFMSDAEKRTLPRGRRMEVKEYFCPERCLYCIDKLNQFADISVGDNYTGEHSDIAGTSSVIVRSQTGKAVLEKYADKFHIWESSIEAVQKSQVLDLRRYNYFWSLYKSEQVGYPVNVLPECCIPSEKGLENIQQNYNMLCKMQAIGRSGRFETLKRHIFKRKIRGKLSMFYRRIVNYLH